MLDFMGIKDPEQREALREAIKKNSEK